MSAIPPWDDRHFPPRENLQNTTNDGLDDSALSRLGINSDIVDDSWDEQETINIDVTETYTPDITPLTTPVIVDEIIIADEINVLNLDANSIQTDLVNINGSIHTTGSAVFDSGVTTSTIYTDNCIFDVEQQNTEIIN